MKIQFLLLSAILTLFFAPPAGADSSPAPIFAHHPTTDTSLVIGVDGELRVWGGGPSIANADFFARPKEVTRWVAASAGMGERSGLFYVALSEHGIIYAFGDNRSGQLAQSANMPTKGWVPIIMPKDFKGFKAVSAGGAHVAALGNDGEIYTWGDNFNGQLGRPYINSRDPGKVVKPPGVNSWKSVSAGANHTIALADTGDVYEWGYIMEARTASGTLLAPAPSNFINLVIFPNPPTEKIQAIAAGANHNLALTTSGQLYAWGNNEYGQCGQNPTILNVPVPMKVAVPAGIKLSTFAAGGTHNLAYGNGKLFAWGYGGEGALGNGRGENSTDLSPVKINGLKSSRSFSVGRGHSLALYSNCTLVAWGANSAGQLGDQTTVNRFEPTPVRIVDICRPLLRTITLSVVDGVATEGGKDWAVLLVRLNYPGEQDLKIPIHVGGTATMGEDYRAIDPALVIPAGKTKALIFIETLDDPQHEETETVEIKLLPVPGYILDGADSAVVKLLDNDRHSGGDKPSVEVFSRRNEISESDKGASIQDNSGIFEFIRTGSARDHLRVNFKIGGSARNGVDYQQIYDGVTIEAGKASAFVRISPIDDAVAEPTESVELAVGYSDGYVIGRNAAAKVAIIDDDGSTPPPPPPPAESPILYYSFNEGGEKVVDQSGHNHTGVLHNGARQVEGGSRLALVLDGVDDHVRVAGSPEFKMHSLTVATWIKARTFAHAGDVDSLISNATPDWRNGGWELYLDNYMLGFSYHPEGGLSTVFRAPEVFKPEDEGTWKHVAATYNYLNGIAYVNLFVNGRAVGNFKKQEPALGYNGQGFLLGLNYDSAAAGYGHGASREFEGFMDEVRLYPRAMSIEQVEKLYRESAGNFGGSTPPPPPPPPPAEPPTVSVTSTDTEAQEVPESGEPPAPPDNARATFQLKGEYQGRLVLKYQVSGTAANGEDYRTLTGEVSVESPRAAISVSVFPIDDTVFEGDETVVITLLSGEGYKLGEPREIQLVIHDNESAPQASASAQRNSDGAVILLFKSIAGTPYLVEISEDLEDWHPLSVVVATSESFEYVDRPDVSMKQRFYRARPALSR